MNRVSTAGSYQTALLNLQAAQNRAMDAQERVSTEKIATDLTGFGRGSETLTALKGAQARISGFMATGEAVAARLSAQDLAFERIGQGVDSARQAIADAIAAGRVEGLMAELQSQFFVTQDGLNSKHQGRYLFSGSDVENAPVAITTLAQLSASPDAASVFGNDQLRSSSRIDEGTSLQTGFLADDVGGAAFDIFRDIQRYQEGQPVTIDGVTFTPAGADSINGQLTEDVSAFLSAQINRLQDAYSGVTGQAAFNGAMQNRVESVLKAQDNQSVALEELVGKRTDADMAQAITDLELSQIAIQASAQVISSLRSTSLLDLLPMR